MLLRPPGILAPRVLSALRRTAAVLAAGAAAAGSLSACATAPSMALERARAAVGAASANPAVALHAPLELQQAAQALAHADGIWRKTHDEAETNHLAYMAARQADVATGAARNRMLAARIRESSSGADRISLQGDANARMRGPAGAMQ